MPEVIIKCLYCGNKWKDYVWSMEARDKACFICKEARNLTYERISDENDVFGYNDKIIKKPDSN